MYKELTPVKEWHSNDNLMAPEGEEENVSTLPVTRSQDRDLPLVCSVWFCSSIWARLYFLFYGKINLMVVGSTHPPLCVTMGPPFIKPKRRNGLPPK